MDAKGENVKRQRLLTNTIWLTSCLLVLLPAVLAWLYVRAFGVNVVFGDSWSVVRLFGEWSSGTLSVWDLYRQHNEHRLFFPNGVELLLGSITRYNNVAEMYLILVCFLVTLVVLLLAFRDGARPWLFFFVPVSFLVFSFRQYENMLWGYQIAFAFTQTFGVLALFLLYLSGRRRFIKLAFLAALWSGTVASFSAVQGLFVWPAGLLQLLISPLEKPTKRVLVVVWGLAGLGEWVFFFAGYKFKGGSSVLDALYHPVVGAQYFLTLLGSPLFWQQDLAFVAGLLLACLALMSLLLIYKDGRLGEYSFWVSLLSYSLFMLAAITLGRSGKFGALQAMAPRYTTFSILAVVSVYAMLAKMVFERRSNLNTILLVALSGVVLIGTSISYSRGIKEGDKERVSREKAAFALSTYESQPDEALTERLNPRASVVRERSPILQRLGYNVFSESQTPGLLPPLSSLSPVTSPTLSTVAVAGPGLSQQGGSIIVPEEGPFVKVGGFALDANNKSTAGGVYVDVDGKFFPAYYGTDRQDVVDSLGVSSYRYSGFERAIPVSEIGVGTHELSIVILTADRKGYYRPDQKVTLEVR
jgi:hypothetical protein